MPARRHLSMEKSKVAELEKQAAVPVAYAPKERMKLIKADAASSTWDSRAKSISDELEKHHAENLPRLILLALLKIEKKQKSKILERFVTDPNFRRMKAESDIVRDKEIFDHLSTTILTGKHFAMLRLMCNLSKRDCRLISATFKHIHFQDGTKTRMKLAKDSKMPLPGIMSLEQIEAVEDEMMVESKIRVHDHADGQGADISAGGEFGLDPCFVDEVNRDRRLLCEQRLRARGD